MPKQNKNESVLHDWVHTLPFQMQALLTTGMRGPDNCSKENPAKELVRYLRGAVLKPAGKVDFITKSEMSWQNNSPFSFFNTNDFMWGNYAAFPLSLMNFWADHDGYPHHFIMHFIHCGQVVAYYHPNKSVRYFWLKFYNAGCESMHMTPETKEQMKARLNDFK